MEKIKVPVSKKEATGQIEEGFQEYVEAKEEREKLLEGNKKEQIKALDLALEEGKGLNEQQKETIENLKEIILELDGGATLNKLEVEINPEKFDSFKDIVCDRMTVTVSLGDGGDGEKLTLHSWGSEEKVYKDHKLIGDARHNEKINKMFYDALEKISSTEGEILGESGGGRTLSLKGNIFKFDATGRSSSQFASDIIDCIFFEFIPSENEQYENRRMYCKNEAYLGSDKYSMDRTMRE